MCWVPSFSIITATLNRRALLAEAIHSVREIRRLYPSLIIEHLVVDGGSLDGTIEWLKNESDIHLLGGTDIGIYDAWNKGIAASKGKIIGFLNSDDVYEAESLGRVMKSLVMNLDLETITGSAEIFGADNRGRVTFRKKLPRPEEPGISVRNALLGIPLINARFFRREVFERVGLFSTKWKVISDCDFMLRAVLAGVKTMMLPDLIYRYRRHDDSLTFDRKALRASLVHDEYLDWTEQWLDRCDNPAELQILLQRCHSRRAWARTCRSLMGGQIKEAVKAINRGWKRDSAWPLAAWDYFLTTLQT